MKKNFIYISICDFDTITTNGVTKKIYQQIKAFEILGYNVFYTGKLGDKFYIFNNDKKFYIMKSNNKYFNDMFIFYKKVTKWILENMDSGIVYVRHYGLNFYTNKMFYKLKQKGFVNVLEIPTYPYKKEYITSIKGKILYLQDFLFSKKIKKNIEFIINFNEYKEIYGIKSIPIENGICIEDYKQHENLNKSENKINLIAVASMRKWHGYDRLIQAIGEYYKTSNSKLDINFHIVGSGPEISKYKQISSTYNIDKNIIFYGELGGQKLDKLFDKCDIAIGSLGLYRIGLERVSTIKSKEYCARGIPFIYAYVEPKISEKEEFVLILENNDSKINMCDIIKFFERSKSIKKEYIREFAEKNLTWTKQYRKIFGRLE
ncbi:glycosyltransferase [Clostridium perfringens]|uniref:glycosyltransferase n=1 Tax=Clostridium perfringens TaxID=1502 RepID=UPI0037E01CB6|nr:glycosyltransferase [Clostridium perfringens]